MLTKKEKTLLDVLKDKKYVSDAKNELQKQGISLPYAYKLLNNIRKKSKRWRTGVNQILGYRRSSPLLDKVLSIRYSVVDDKT